MNSPDESSLPAKKDRDFEDSTERPRHDKLNIRPRGIDEHSEPDPDENPRSHPRKTGHLPVFDASPDRTHRRRRSRKDSLKAVKTGFPFQNWKTIAAIALSAIFVASNIFVGHFFYHSGVAEGIKRATDAHSPMQDTASPATAATHKAFGALLNLRGTKPDRPSTEILTLLCLQALEQTGDDNLPSYLSQGHTTPEDFCAAYVAMRLGDFGKAAAILRATEKAIPPDLFIYLINDSVMRRFAREPRLMGFYEKS